MIDGAIKQLEHRRDWGALLDQTLGAPMRQGRAAHFLGAPRGNPEQSKPFAFEEPVVRRGVAVPDKFVRVIGWLLEAGVIPGETAAGLSSEFFRVIGEDRQILVIAMQHPAGRGPLRAINSLEYHRVVDI